MKPVNTNFLYTSIIDCWSPVNNTPKNNNNNKINNNNNKIIIIEVT